MNAKEYFEGLTDVLVATLCSSHNVKTFRSILVERKLKRYKENSVRVALSRLHKKGYINHSRSGWSINKKGKDRHKSIRLFEYIHPIAKEKIEYRNIVSFDIPECDRIKRDWLRNQLKIFGYKMLQQSLWIGPGPLPDLFSKRLNLLKIKNGVKIFKITKQNN